MKIKIEGGVHNSIIGDINTETFIQNQYNNENSKKTFDKNQILNDLVDKSIRLLERKNKLSKIEDLYNDDFTHFLRDLGYYTTDQTRTGKALKTVGEVDIMIRKENGTPVSIIEAFRLSSCGKDNSVISKHLNKLLHDYDTAGHKRNFVLVYAEASNFSKLWDSYCEYQKDLNNKPDFKGKHKLKTFEDTNDKFSKVTDVKVGKAIHEREKQDIEIFHVFINMT